MSDLFSFLISSYSWLFVEEVFNPNPIFSPSLDVALSSSSSKAHFPFRFPSFLLLFIICSHVGVFKGLFGLSDNREERIENGHCWIENRERKG
jgi:hypothetical protein